MEGKFICPHCGKGYNNKRSLVSHKIHCESKLGLRLKVLNINDYHKSNPDWSKQQHKLVGDVTYKRVTSLGEDNPLIKFSRTPSESRDEAHKKQSETRKRKYLSGELTPADGVGNSFGSYFNGKYIRSSYEMIYISYLFLNSFDYKYESVRVNYNNKSYISDFEIDGVLVEVKGNIGKIPEVKLAFENNGYNIRFICPNDIQLIKLYLRNLIDIDSLLVILKDSRKLKKQLYWSINKSNGDIRYKIINKGDNPDSYEYKILPFRNPSKP